MDKFDIDSLHDWIRRRTKLRSPLLDIDSHTLKEVNTRFDNMMWYCGVTDLKHRDLLTSFVAKIPKTLGRFPDGYFKEGYRPVPKGVSSFLFLTRALNPSRTREAFLSFDTETTTNVKASSPLGTPFNIERSSLTRTLGTAIGLRSMDITGQTDFIARRKYTKFDDVLKACGFEARDNHNWESFWTNCKRELDSKQTRLVVLRRINPFAPSTSHMALYSNDLMSPSNQVNLIMEKDETIGQAICVLMNSILFISQFFLLKEESTGRYIDIRFYDLYQMLLYPSKGLAKKLVAVYNRFCNTAFPSLREQLDSNFSARYKEFWRGESNAVQQAGFWDVLKEPILPNEHRLALDLAVCKVLGMDVSKSDLVAVYETLVKEMIITRHLTRD